VGRTVSRSARTGRFVSGTTAKRSPRTTVTQKINTGRSKKRRVHQSAITGRFVTEATVKRHPDTTISQDV